MSTDNRSPDLSAIILDTISLNPSAFFFEGRMQLYVINVKSPYSFVPGMQTL